MADVLSGAGQGASSGAAIGSIIPGVGTAIGGAVGAVLGGIAGLLGSSGEQQKAKAALEKAQAIIDAYHVDPEASKEIFMSELKNAGVWTPEMQTAVSAGVSKAAEAKGSTEGEAAQKASLAALEQLSRQGVSAEDRAKLAEFIQQANTQAQGQRQAIVQQAQMRGQSGGGTELAAQLAAAQGGAEIASKGALSQAAASQAARMAALQQAAQLGGTMSQQEFERQYSTGKATDAMQQFNVENQRAVQAANVAAQNEARKYDVTNKQNLATSQAQLNYQADLANRAAKQWANQQEANKAAMAANAATGAANAYTTQAQNTAEGYAKLGTGLGTAVGSLPSVSKWLSGGDAAKTEAATTPTAGTVPATAARTTTASPAATAAPALTDEELNAKLYGDRTTLPDYLR